MKRIVPLIGSDVASLIGIIHLPRLWLKALLASVDALPEGYHSGARGFDEHLIEHFGLDRDAFMAFLATRPTYLETEAWVRAHTGRLDADSLAAWGRTIHEWLRAEDRAAQACAQLGVRGIRSTAMLNALDDWQAVHADVLAHRGEPVVPAISSSSVGPLGAKHLPRLWLKAILLAVGSLPETWRSGPGMPGMDDTTYEDLGIDGPAAVRYLESALPNYVAFEGWVREHGTKLDAEAIARHNATVIRDKPDERGQPERDELGIADRSVRTNQVLNDLLDWKALHGVIAAAARSYAL